MIISIQFPFQKVKAKAILRIVRSDNFGYQFHCILIEYIISKYHNEFRGTYKQLARVADNIRR